MLLEGIQPSHRSRVPHTTPSSFVKKVVFKIQPQSKKAGNEELTPSSGFRFPEEFAAMISTPKAFNNLAVSLAI